jgi:hypothetical protein
MTHRQAAARASGRRGIVLAEMIVTLTILGLCLGILAQFSKVYFFGGRTLHRRAVALELATNVLEEYRVKSWDELVPGEPQKRAVPEPFTDWFKQPSIKYDMKPIIMPEGEELIPEGEVWVRVTAHDQDGLPCRRVAVEVRWSEPSPPRNERLELAAFRCPRSGSAER